MESVTQSIFCFVFSMDSLTQSRTVLIRRRKKEVESDLHLPPKTRSLAYIKADQSKLQVCSSSVLL